MRVSTTRIVSLVLVILFSLTPEILFAMAGQENPQSGPPAARENAPHQENNQPPASPVSPTAEAPMNSPTSAGEHAATPQETAQPEGTAAARATRTIGGPASKPAGSAVAPAKQRQVRSLLIKIGAIAGAGAALGTVYALTRGTPTKPPGAH